MHPPPLINPSLCDEQGKKEASMSNSHNYFYEYELNRCEGAAFARQCIGLSLRYVWEQLATVLNAYEKCACTPMLTAGSRSTANMLRCPMRTTPTLQAWLRELRELRRLTAQSAPTMALPTRPWTASGSTANAARRRKRLSLQQPVEMHPRTTRWEASQRAASKGPRRSTKLRRPPSLQHTATAPTDSLTTQPPTSSCTPWQRQATSMQRCNRVS